MYPVPNFDSYQKQATDLAQKISQLNAQYMPQQSPPPSIQYVNGIEGAKAYQRDMAPNGKAVLMDSNENSFFVVSKDANGVCAPVMIGRFTLEQEQPAEASYVMKEDFEAFKQELRTMLGGKKE